ncbi:MAG: type I-PGING CRISPR-associated protein Cas5p [Bacteroidales bacterium]|nr:type I-PGING CRISPR-associated protein Cas5p [Candidatus Scybalocola fimicaballi]
MKGEMMMDISILGKEPILNKMAVLTITPLAPLSMVAEMPGSYYKSLKMPNKKMLCGLIENILGWHFNLETRKIISNDMKQCRKKMKLTFESHVEGSTYIPLLMDFFQIIDTPKLCFDAVCFYDDIWARNHSRKDSAIMHAPKCRNVSNELYNKLYLDKVDKKEHAYKDYEERVKSLSPNFYPVLPTKREYIDYQNGSYIYKLTMDKRLFEMIRDKLIRYNIGYLGNSEGWVNLNISDND